MLTRRGLLAGATTIAAGGAAFAQSAPVALVYGDQETPEFQRQNRDFFAAVKQAGKPATLSLMVGFNHFEVMESLGNPYSLFGRAALGTMKLEPA